MDFTNDELLHKANSGDKEAFNLLVAKNSGLVWSIVKRFLNRGYEKDDLYQLGCIGLIKAIKKFDFSFNTQFSTYAVPYIVGEIKKFLRDDGIVKVSRYLKETAGKVKLSTEFFFAKNGIEPTVSELSKHLGIQEDEIIMALDVMKPTESLNATLNDDDKNPIFLLDKISGSDGEEDKQIEKIILKQLMADLTPKERQIISMRYLKGETQGKVAYMLGISQVQVSRMEKRIIDNMRRNIV
jgi:RNA polymerase sporulation-specific sigma factor